MALGSAADHPAREAAGRIPVVAVVDAWNFRSQVRAAFGHPRHATVDGIIGAFRPYGFEVVEVCFALGVELAAGSRSRARPPSADLAKALRRNAETKLRWEADPRARVLAGRLVEVTDAKGGQAQPAEKMVDVLCAVEICRLAVRIRDGDTAARGIICLSKDMDLIPAYRFSEEMGVPCWVAARDTVHHRRDEHRWLLLNDAATAAVSALRDPSIRARRRLVADAALFIAQNRPTKMTMIVDYVDEARYFIALRGEQNGLPGRISPRSSPGVIRPGRRLNVWPAGVHFGPSDDHFPTVAFDTERPRRTPESIEVVQVDRWIDQTNVRVRVHGKLQRLRVPVGSTAPGTNVVVQVDRSHTLRYIGPAANDPRRSASPSQTNVMIARVVRPSIDLQDTTPELSRAMRYCLADVDGHQVTLMHSERNIQAGDCLPVLIADPRSDDSAKIPLAMQIGSRITPL